MDKEATPAMIEITLLQQDDFLKIRETLQRIGVPSYKQKTLFQSCHILHKRGKYYIVHFKELFVLDGKSANISNEDIIRRDKIIDLLQQWNLIKVVDGQQLSDVDSKEAEKVKVKVIPHREKNLWKLTAKYTLGKSNE